MLPPRAKKAAFTHAKGERSDPYHWLAKKDDPAVIDYLNAENAYTQAIFEPLKSQEKQLFDEMVSRIEEDDVSAPWPHHDYHYYFRTYKSKEYAVFCRKSSAQNSPEEILVDENELAKQHDYFSVSTYELSPDGNWLAFTVDTTGDEYYQLFILDLNTKKLLADTLTDIGGDLTFAADNQTLLYVKLDETHRPYQIWQHRINTSETSDTCLFEEKDARFFIGASRSKDDRVLFIDSHSKITSEVHYVDALHPTQPLTCIFPREPSVEYHVEHYENTFLVLTNHEATQFKVVQVPVENPDLNTAKVFQAHDDNVMIESLEVFKDFIVLTERVKGLPALHVYHVRKNKDYHIEFPEETYDVGCEGNNDIYDTPYLRLFYTSFVTPASVFEFHCDTRERRLLKQQAVKGDYNPDNYQSKRLMATASDGTEIPISLLYKKGGTLPLPLYLNAYGAYGYSIDPYFSSTRLSLLDRGIAFAIAHIRGGGEYGKKWHDAGKLLQKKNSFTDFIACSEYLIHEKYTTPSQLMISGGSAGGLLMGAVLNARPELFHGAIAHVPFVDVLTTMLDPSLPLTITEYEEWGNPEEKAAYSYIASYSPYDNVKHQAYPNIFMIGGLHDTRVSYWEPAKWTAKLREYKTDHNLLLLKTEMTAGHAGVSGRYQRLKELAEEFAFVLLIASRD